MNVKQNRPGILIILGVLFLLILAAMLSVYLKPAQTGGFDGNPAYQDVAYQVGLGARTPGSSAHAVEVKWIVQELKKAGWQTETQDGQMMEHPYQNIVAKLGSGTPWIILGAHYDSRMTADQDPNVAKRIQPVPGADDGASGVAVLLELARTIPTNLHGQIWLVFFDIEDQGDIPGWDWILGSKAFANNLNGKPDAVVVIDMIGDKDLNIFMEKNSNPTLNQEIWSQAAALGYQDEFIPKYKYSMEDDHSPFLQKGILAVDLIDFDYPYWHTTADTIDKVSARSLRIVGDTLLHWISVHE
ncbi:MAG TPA: M28 family peptidase [Anaerolineaceae bacterium]|nr:M28 family peptidase [Anaerolineaceae bacterium]